MSWSVCQPETNQKRCHDQADIHRGPESDAETFGKRQRHEEWQAERHKDQRLAGHLRQTLYVMIPAPRSSKCQNADQRKCEQQCPQSRRPARDFDTARIIKTGMITRSKRENIIEFRLCNLKVERQRVTAKC